MKTLQDYKPQIREYLFENIDNLEIRVSLAWDFMYKWRCPFEYADNQLYNLMYDYAQEWIEGEFEQEDAEALLSELDEYFIEGLI